MNNYGIWDTAKNIITKNTSSGAKMGSYGMSVASRWTPEDNTDKIIELLELYFSGKMPKTKGNRAQKPNNNLRGTMMMFETFIDIWDFFEPENKELAKYKTKSKKLNFICGSTTGPITIDLEEYTRRLLKKEKAERALMKTLERQQSRLGGINGKRP